MALFAYIVDGVLQSVGDLPASARRDTGEVVVDLAGTGAQWQRSCGYWPVDGLNPADVTNDPAKQAQLATDLAAATTASDGRQAFLNKLDQSIAALLSNSWDFLDAYSDRVWPGQQDAGGSWPQFDTTPPGTTLTSVGTYLTLRTNVLAARLEIIRTQESFNTYALTRLANFLSVLEEVLERLIVDDPNIVPPPDR